MEEEENRQMEIPSVAIHPSSPPAQADQPSVAAQETDTARAAAGKILPPSFPPSRLSTKEVGIYQ